MNRSPIAQAVRNGTREPKAFKLAICIPCQDSWKSHFGASLAVLCADLVSHPPPGYDACKFDVLMNGGTMLPSQRQKLAETAIAGGYTHMLFLDSDMTFPANTVHRLLATGKPIAACNYSTRRPPLRSTAAVFKEGGELQTIDPEQGFGGVHEVDAAGTGVMLIQLSVFEKLEKPWFAFEYTPDGWTGEDFYFCLKAGRAGFRPVVDLDLSREIGHVGSYTYTLTEVVDPT